ncbi:MerR family transcriptional regulator [Flexivirga caeni]|uniref:MerR family transcriptional regulator n=1 Tax=Flexivirga caeni TaxID=2294115 RepID=A0A3M9MCG0_9MICO|nr:MerR family transcriptional regulator [Flexivirga caeni]RNI23251.1 MerR family transcriptional regulator [Flexivirga caeni]
MRISEVSAQTHVPVATLKYYLREGLLHSGTATSRTQATYDESHLDRVRLIRALLEPGGLSIARVRQVLETLDGPNVDRHDLLGAAQRAITPALPEHPDAEWTEFARKFATQHGWEIEPDDPLLTLLGDQLRAIVAAGIAWDDQDTLERYAQAADQLANIDISSVPGNPDAAIRQVAIGTVLTDPLILTLRRLAQQALSAELADA